MPQNKATIRIAAITGKLAAALAVLLATTPLFGDTAEIDIAALAAATNQFTSECKIATTNGWTLCDIDSYSEKNGVANIRINRNVKDEYIDSPTFDHPIIRIELKVKSSGQTDRRLAFIPIYNGIPTADTNLWARCEYSPTKDTYVPQTNFFPRSAELHAFRMALDDGGGSTGWGVSMMTIITDDTPQLTPPSELHTDNIKGTRFALSWTNPENAVSNKVEVFRVVRHEERGTMEREYNFNEFSNKGGTGPKTESILAAYPDLEGFALYLPTNSTGQIQLSNSDNKGVLSFPGFESCANLHLRLLARHYNHADEAKSVSIGYVQGQTTNDFSFVKLTKEFTTSFTPLSSVPTNARIIINNSGNATYHRVIIDEIDFIRDYVPAHAETNLVKTAFRSGSTTYSVRGLCPRTEYVARITAFDADGNESSPSEPLAVTTNGDAIPFSIRIQ